MNRQQRLGTKLMQTKGPQDWERWSTTSPELSLALNSLRSGYMQACTLLIPLWPGMGAQRGPIPTWHWYERDIRQ